jgi:manganese-dependent inorganic pyrophosphatase
VCEAAAQAVDRIEESTLTSPAGSHPSTIYVTGHRNPDTDSIASALGYAELKQRLNPAERYEAVRLGDVNAQTSWALEKAGIEAPAFLEHIMPAM